MPLRPADTEDARISERPKCLSAPLHKEQGEEAEVPEGPYSLSHWLRGQNGGPGVNGRGDGGRGRRRRSLRLVVADGPGQPGFGEASPEQGHFYMMW